MPDPSKVQRYVTVTSGFRGFFAVLVWWNQDGFWEPEESDGESFKTEREAVPRAVVVAEVCRVPFVLKGYSSKGEALN